MADTSPLRGRKLLFVVTEDWFFVSHFLPMARAAVAAGMQVVVATRLERHADAIAATGARPVGFAFHRSSSHPVRLIAEVWRLRRLLREERADIVHCISLKSILVGGLAGRLAGIGRRVYAVTGLGLIGARRDLGGRAARAVLRYGVRPAIGGRRCHYLCENPDDPKVFGLDPDDPGKVTIVPGAGVDPEAFPARPLPPSPPVRIAVVSRMLWSKGIDLAVEAVRRARASGAEVTLSLYGDGDADNPKAVPQDTLEAWGRLDGIDWHGRTGNVAGVWAGHHVCCLASRGGEGLPRSLLEGAASGRAVVTTDVPGCRHAIRDGVDGLVVPAGDAGALADAFARIAGDADLLARMGRSARQRILDGHTEAAVEATVIAMYRRIIG